MTGSCKYSFIPLLALIVLSGTRAGAQDDKEAPGFSDKKMYLSTGYGFPNFYKGTLRIGMLLAESSFESNGNVKGELTYNINGSGPYFLKFEKAYSDNVGVGVTLGYLNVGLKFTYNYSELVMNSPGNYITNYYTVVQKTDVNSYTGAIRFNYHFLPKRSVDPYIGFAGGITYNQIKLSITNTNPAGLSFSYKPGGFFPLHIGASLGLRFSFNSSMAFYTEVGVEKLSFIQGGFTFRL